MAPDRQYSEIVLLSTTSYNINKTLNPGFKPKRISVYSYNDANQATPLVVWSDVTGRYCPLVVCNTGSDQPVWSIDPTQFIDGGQYRFVTCNKSGTPTAPTSDMILMIQYFDSDRLLGV